MALELHVTANRIHFVAAAIVGLYHSVAQSDLWATTLLVLKPTVVSQIS